jgi:hypothetical protein
MITLTWTTWLARGNSAKLSLVHVVVPDTLTYMTPDSLGAAPDLQENGRRRKCNESENG